MQILQKIRQKDIGRGSSYIRQNKAIDFSTILIAPKRYHNDLLKGFDSRINYEKILDYFQNAKSLGK